MTTLQFLASPFCRFLRDESGTTAIEYAIIAGGIAVAIVATVTSVGSKVNGMFERVQAAWPS